MHPWKSFRDAQRDSDHVISVVERHICRLNSPPGRPKFNVIIGVIVYDFHNYDFKSQTLRAASVSLY